MTGWSFAGAPEQETFTARPSTVIFLAPVNTSAAGLAASVAGGGLASWASSHPVSVTPTTAQHSATAAETLLLRAIRPPSPDPQRKCCGRGESYGSGARK